MGNEAGEGNIAFRAVRDYSAETATQKVHRVLPKSLTSRCICKGSKWISSGPSARVCSNMDNDISSKITHQE